MTVKQLSIFVENKSGRMAEIAEMIAKAGIDIRALSIADTTNYGILRLIVDQPERAEEALRGKGLTLSLTEVLAVRMADKPGGFAAVLRALAEAEVNVEYLYAFICREKDCAAVILRVEDNARAIDVLQSRGIELLDGEQLMRL